MLAEWVATDCQCYVPELVHRVSAMPEVEMSTDAMRCYADFRAVSVHVVRRETACVCV